MQQSTLTCCRVLDAHFCPAGRQGCGQRGPGGWPGGGHQERGGGHLCGHRDAAGEGEGQWSGGHVKVFVVHGTWLGIEALQVSTWLSCSVHASMCRHRPVLWRDVEQSRRSRAHTMRALPGVMPSPCLLPLPLPLPPPVHPRAQDCGAAGGGSGQRSHPGRRQPGAPHNYLKCDQSRLIRQCNGWRQPGRSARWHALWSRVDSVRRPLFMITCAQPLRCCHYCRWTLTACASTAAPSASPSRCAAGCALSCTAGNLAHELSDAADQLNRPAGVLYATHKVGQVVAACPVHT